jgi:hypothetical protein
MLHATDIIRRNDVAASAGVQRCVVSDGCKSSGNKKAHGEVGLKDLAGC